MVVKVIPCFSKPRDGQKGQHVPDTWWEHGERKDGANVYTCGSAARLESSSAAMWRQVWSEKVGKSDGEAHEWLHRVNNER